MFDKNVRTVAGVYGSPDFIGEIDVDYVYSTDRSFTVVTTHEVPASGVTRYFRYVAYLTGTTTPSRTYLGRAVGHGDGNFTLAESPSGSLSGPWTHVLDRYSASSTFSLNMGLAVLLGLEEQAGNYFVTEQSWDEGDSEPSASTITTFDLRVLALKNLRADRPAINTNSRNNKTTIRGDWMALPASTSLYPDGWSPTGSISWKVPITDSAGIPIRLVTGVSHLIANDAGKVATLVAVWDAKNHGGQIVEGVRYFNVTGRAPVPHLGTTTSRVKQGQVLCRHCVGGLDGIHRTSLALDSVGSLTPELSYNGVMAQEQPASMGFGWNFNGNIRVYDDSANGDLVYQDESGGALRWSRSGGQYFPTFQDNYTTAVKVTGNPDFVYAITFTDQTRREFGADGKMTRELDRNGNSKIYGYASGQLVSITENTGRAVYFGYGGRSDGQITSLRVNDPDTGRLTSFEYYPETHAISPNRLKTVTNPAGEATIYSYDLAGNIISVVDPRGQVALTNTFDELGRKLTEQIYDQLLITYDYPQSPSVVTITEHDLTGAAPDRTQTMHYDDNFNVVQIDEVVDETTVNTTLMSYEDPKNRYLLTRTVAPNLSTRSMTYNGQGNLKSETNDHGRVTVYEYAEDIDAPLNPRHRNLLRKIHRSPVTVDGVLTTYPATELQYDERGNLIAVVDAMGHSTIFTVRSDGLVSAITDRRGFTTHFAYSSQRTLQSVTTPAGRTTVFEHDEFDNLISTQDPLGNTVSAVFDANDRPTRLTDARGKYVEMNYLDGLLTSLEAPPNAGSGTNRRLSQYSYDNASRLTAVSAQITPISSQFRVGYAYNGFSNLKQLVRLMNGSNKSVSYQHDRLGRMVRSTDFLGNPTTVEYAPFCVENTVTTARGVQISSHFDSLCRPTQRASDDELHLFTHDELDRPLTATVGSRYGWLKGTQRVGGVYGLGSYAHTTRFRHDALDRVTQIDYANGDTVGYQHDLEGNVTSVTRSDGTSTLYSYYNDNRLHQVTFQAPGQADRVFTYLYDLAGRLESITYPASTGIVASFTQTDGSTGWNPNGQLLCLRYLKNGVHFHRFEYSLDDSGNRTQLIDTPTNLANAVTWAFNYDWLNRLTEVSRNGVVHSVYGYDESDNRVSLSLPLVDEVHSYSLDLADRIQSRSVSVSGGAPAVVESFLHDLDGNMTSRTLAGETTTYNWSAFNKMRQRKVDGAVKETNAFDASGIRRLKRENGVSTRYFSSGAMSLADQRPTESVNFIQGHQILGMVQGGNPYYYITDGLSSCRVLVDVDGNEAASASYNEFGMPENVSDPDGLLNHGYVGGLGVRNETAGSGLLYMRQRFYDPGLGRWLSEDPIGFAGGLKVFAYVENSPTNFVDISGLVPMAPVVPGIGTPAAGSWGAASGATDVVTTGSAASQAPAAGAGLTGFGTIGIGVVAVGAGVIGYYGARAIQGINQGTNATEQLSNTQDMRIAQLQKINNQLRFDIQNGFKQVNEYSRNMLVAYPGKDPENKKKCDALRELLKKACGSEKNKITAALKYFGCKDKNKRAERNTGG